jgi:hypothetical protein
VDLDGGSTDVGGAVRDTCRDEDRLSGTDSPADVTEPSFGVSYDDGDRLIDIVRVKWNPVAGGDRFPNDGNLVDASVWIAGVDDQAPRAIRPVVVGIAHHRDRGCRLDDAHAAPIIGPAAA